MSYLVFKRRNQPVTTSLLVAQKFNKQHKHILSSIREILTTAENLSVLNMFSESTYLNEQNKKQPMYIIDQDGFSLLVMGFTGKEAMKFKLDFINAFNQMRAIISNHQSSIWIESRNNGKLIRRQETDTIQEFVEYATTQGSKSANKYYMNITKITNKALEFLVQVKEGSNIRDLLDAKELFFVGVLENRANEAILDGMDKGMYYKDIYIYAKEEVNALAKSMKFIPKQKKIA